MKLIVGLGNPGKAYTNTRHNIGFLTVQRLAEVFGGRFHPAHEGMAAKVIIDGCSCLLLMPMTMMNNSGVSVRAVAARSGIPSSEILVVYDDMALGFGTLRIRPSGSAGGHNGVKSIIAQMGTQEFARLRMGVSKAPQGVDAADYVLAKFTSAEQKALADFINTASLAVHSWVTQGVEAAMNEYNGNTTTKEQA